MRKKVFTIVNSQTAYSLDHKVTDENELRLVINNVVQEPGTGKAYTASGNTLTLASALTNGTDEMYCIFLGKARETSTVPDSFITKNKLNLISTSSSAGLEVKGDGSSQDGYLQLNCSQNSHGVKIKSPPHSAGQSYTLTLPSSVSADTFLKTDGSGNLSFAAAGGTMTPAFFAKKNATQSTGNNAFTKITYETEDVDTDGAFASSRFTVPSGKAGKYFVGFNKMNNKGGSTAEDYTMIYKNGSSIGNFPHFGGASPTIMKSQQIIIDLAVADYLEVYHYGTTTNSSAGSLLDGVRNSFYGYKIIE
jgi:hypothetical protein